VKSIRSLGALLALILVFHSGLYSQAVTGTVLGTVTDSTSAVIANAKVTLTEVKRGFLIPARPIMVVTTRFPIFPKAPIRSL
jgi:hypothetical protein